jgi:transcriptional regulator with XRE-family HTH domain
MTIRELAAAAGVSTNTISRLERGEDGYAATIRKLAKALGVKPAELMDEQG